MESIPKVVPVQAEFRVRWLLTEKLDSDSEWCLSETSESINDVAFGLLSNDSPSL